MNKIVRLVKEMGVVISIEHKDAFEGFKDKNGKEIPSQPERYKVVVASGQEFDEKCGFLNGAINEYTVKDLKMGASLKFMTPVWAVFELSEKGIRPQELSLRNEKN